MVYFPIEALEKIILASPRGFCAGVERAILVVEEVLKRVGSPIYVRNDIVHNRSVVEQFKKRGVIFVKTIEEVPEHAVAIFSAHGVSKQVEEAANKRHLTVIDATCPLVTKVHLEAKRHEKQGRQVILIGHAGHPEVEGTAGQLESPVYLIQTKEDAENLVVEGPVAYVTQTTLGVEDAKEIIAVLKRKFPHIEGPDTKDICYATQNRQEAVRKLAEEVDMVWVLGSSHSSNSNRLRDLVRDYGKPAYLIDSITHANPNWLAGIKTLGITAGASAPETLVQHVITTLLSAKPTLEVHTLSGREEAIHFRLPKALECVVKK